jgi:hypothetical protein
MCLLDLNAPKIMEITKVLESKISLKILIKSASVALAEELATIISST